MRLIKIKVVGLHPTPDQGGLLVLSSLDAPRRPYGVESPLCSLTNLLSLPGCVPAAKASSPSMANSRNLSIRPAATPKEVYSLEFESLDSDSSAKNKREK